MSFYSVVLFVHIVGALTLFMGFAVEWVSLLHMQRAATPDQARAWINVSSGIRPFGIAGMLVIVFAGGYLVARMEAGGQGWVWVALAGTFSTAALAMVLTRPRMQGIRRALGDDSRGLPEPLARHLRDPILRVSMYLRTAIALGIVFLMTSKPHLGAALLTLGLAAVAGLLPTFLTWGRHRVAG